MPLPPGWAERGYITYAPQNPYIGYHEFRTLQRKANPLGWTLFTFAIAQHEQQLRWLSSLPYVDPDRIGFYGLVLRRQSGHAHSDSAHPVRAFNLLGRL